MATDQFIEAIEARARIAEFLRQHENRGGAHEEIIYTVFSDPEAAPAQLLASDLRAILAEVVD